MYAVVGCTECSSLWVIEQGGDSATCPRCGKRHQTKKLRHFAEAAEADDAREARAALVANRRGAGDAAPSFGDLEASIGEDVIDDETQLEAAGIDPEAVAEAGERASGGGGSRSRREIVLDAFDVHEEPDGAAIRDYAEEHGVPREYVDRALRKLEGRGEIVETRSGYRRL
ncbi:hypothetical protein L593_00860 [Salinarchaeum sp. Harcht-Bsk1]|uniref:DUF5817 domain-containing protein n=1 Tax=Salinarchaeum sp. Harcht-Bsk1 TaxID=1333523 RepID=UPI00034227BF|nr:DUF5817 domain-containing protein [Salinarchaeum sp. Harcht-Bsk1]AGN00127.1 hypothetical protein L593_00860 [Salinarchaeum sp. Harcht-Bsk1]